MTIQEENYRGDLFVKRFFKLPIMASALDQFNVLYQTTKERNSLLKFSLNSAETGFNLAVGAAKPVVGKFENQINYLNNMACGQLDKAEEKYPIISKPTEEIVESTKNTFKSVIQPFANQIISAKVYGNVKINHVKSSAIETISFAVNYSLDKSYKIAENIPGGQFVIKNADYSLTLADLYVDKFMPKDVDDKDELDSTKVPVDEYNESQYLLRKTFYVGNKLRRRISRKVAKNLNELQIKSLESKNYTVEKAYETRNLTIGKLVGAKDYAIGSIVSAKVFAFSTISKTTIAGLSAAKNGGTWIVDKIGVYPLGKKALQSFEQGLDYVVWYLDETIEKDNDNVNIESLTNSAQIGDKAYYVAYKFKHRVNVGVQSLLRQAGNKKDELNQFSTYYVLYPVKKAEQIRDKLQMILDASLKTEQEIYNEYKDETYKYSDFDKALISTSHQLIYNSKKFYNVVTFVPRNMVESIVDSAKYLNRSFIETQIKKVLSMPIIQSNVVIPMNDYLKTPPQFIGYLINTPTKAITYLNDLVPVELANRISTRSGQLVTYALGTPEKLITFIVSTQGKLLAYFYSFKENGKKID